MVGGFAKLRAIRENRGCVDFDPGGPTFTFAPAACTEPWGPTLLFIVPVEKPHSPRNAKHTGADAHLWRRGAISKNWSTLALMGTADGGNQSEVNESRQHWKKASPMLFFPEHSTDSRKPPYSSDIMAACTLKARLIAGCSTYCSKKQLRSVSPISLR